MKPMTKKKKKKEELRPMGPQMKEGMQPMDKSLRPCDMPGKGLRKSPG